VPRRTRSFAKLKEREVWLNEYETLDDARQRLRPPGDSYAEIRSHAAGVTGT
jgi:hypothetical protein